MVFGLFLRKTKGGGPIRRLKLIMWPEGKWEASKKNCTRWRRTTDGRTDGRTDGQTDMATLWLNRPSGADSVREKKLLFKNQEKTACIHVCNFHKVYLNCNNLKILLLHIMWTKIIFSGNRVYYIIFPLPVGRV